MGRPPDTFYNSVKVVGPHAPACQMPRRTNALGKRPGDPCESTNLVEIVNGVALCWTHRKAVEAGLAKLVDAPAPLEQTRNRGNERWQRLGRGIREE